MTKFIVGCGYLGSRVAQRWLAAGDAVTAVTRSDEKARELRENGLQTIVADVTRPETLGKLPAAETVLYAVGYNPGSGKSRRQVYVEGLQNVLDSLPADTGRVIFISSTGVYGDAEGDWVDEQTPCQPTREAGQAFLAAEQVLGHHRLGARAVILRLAGIYGAGRLPRKDDILDGKPIPALADSWLNLIHVDDAAVAVLAASISPLPLGERPSISPLPLGEGPGVRAVVSPRTYIISDGHPVDRRECFRYLAELLKAPPPRFVNPPAEFLATHHSGSNKRVSNARMLAELGFLPTHCSYKEGLDAIVQGENIDRYIG